jgi:DNA-binding NtrC family response regulator
MNVLIVDDEPEILTIVSKWLSRNGYHVITTSDPQKALELVETTEIDVILLDLLMPGSSGINLISRIKERKETQKIIVMSVIEDMRVAILAAQEGIEGYLTKPIEFEKLEELLNRIKPQ